MVEDTVSQQREHARVSRNDLPQLIPTGTRSIDEKELMQHLRSRAVYFRRSRHAQAGGQSRGQIVDAISIPERPPQRLRIVPFPVIGKAICSAAPATVTRHRNAGGTTFAFHHPGLKYLAKIRQRSLLRWSSNRCVSSPRVSEALVDVGSRGWRCAKHKSFHGRHEGA